MIPMDLGRRVDRNVVDLGGRRQQPRQLLDSEHLRGPLLGRAVDAPPCPLLAPLLAPSLRVRKVDELLASEERAAHELHLALNTWLVLRRTHPSRGDQEAPRLRVLDERLVEKIHGALMPRRVARRGVRRMSAHPTMPRPPAGRPWLSACCAG
jgi:hypothetical protein